MQLERERLRSLERVLAEQEGLPPAARALAEQGEKLALGALDVEAGSERAVAAALRARASAVLADEPREALALLEHARANGLGSLTVLAGRDPQELVQELPVVALESLLDATAPSVTREGYGYDPERGELWFAGETAEAVLLELEARRRELAARRSRSRTARRGGRSGRGRGRGARTGCRSRSRTGVAGAAAARDRP